jgi:hypothetical protein
MAPSKKKSNKTAKAKKRKSTFAVSISGDEVRYFVSVLNKRDLRRLRGKGIQTEAGVMTLSETLSGAEECSWVSQLAVAAFVNNKEVTTHESKKASNPDTADYRGKDVIFVEQTIDKAEYAGSIKSDSIDDIRIESRVDEIWILPDGRKVEIRSVSVVTPKEAGLEYVDGGGGYIQGWLITADGEVIELEENEDDDSGECLVTAQMHT